MERAPTPNQVAHERAPERILTSEQVIEALSQYAEGFTLGRELSDEKGVYLREVEVAGDKEGETTEYQYMRKGNHGRNQSSLETLIWAYYYQDGIPIHGEKIAVLNEVTGEWQKI